MDSTTTNAWENYWLLVESLKKLLNSSKAVQVNSKSVRVETRDLVQNYFRLVRPELKAIGIIDGSLLLLDGPCQELLRLAGGRNRRTSYKKELRTLTKARSPLEIEREELFSISAAPTGHATISPIETLIVDTARKIIPSAAISYEQALNDLYGPDRISYRGTATELREALREVLDHLAPDSEVSKSDGFKLEKNAQRPTMKQKARFILKARGVSKNSLASPQDAVQRIEESAASLARSTYTRSSISTHVATTKSEVLTMKMYVDTVLSELLQVHGG